MSDYYWHFATVGEDGVPRLGHGDNREVRVGETLTVEGTPVLCGRGLRASRSAIDALHYVRTERVALCRVTLGGTVLHDHDKSAATERTVVAILDADATEALLHGFARWCAMQVIYLWDAPDVVRQYLETGDESIRAAAEAAAWAAVWATAGAAAGIAARAAARAAAWVAAGAVAEDAVWATAWAAAWAAQNAWLEAEALQRMGLQDGVREAFDAQPANAAAQPAILEPDWSQAPEWAQWWATDKDGRAYWHGNEPTIVHDNEWYSGLPVAHDKLGIDWRTTLRQRPAKGQED